MAEILGTFEQIVLLAVLSLGDDAYGRLILREAQTTVPEERALAAGAVYSTLNRLEQKQYLASRLDEGTPERKGRARRFYRVTPQGAEALNSTRKTLDRIWHGRTHQLEALS